MSTTPIGAAANVSAKAEVVKKNSLKFSPRIMDPAHPLHAQGFTFACVDVASGAVVKGFTNEDECREFCEDQNSK